MEVNGLRSRRSHLKVLVTPIVTTKTSGDHVRPDKDAANLRKHGILLNRAADIDFETGIYVPDERYDYVEKRTRALGQIDGRVHKLVFTIRDETLRAISLRKANPKEVGLYDEKS